jgi:hypothetical protein
MQRAIFFLVAGLICLVLVPVTPSDLRWVPEVLTVAYVILSLLSWLDARSTRRRA